LGDRLGQGFVLVGGLVLLALGVAGLSFSTSLPLTLAAVCLAGLGHGSSDLSSLVLAAERYKDRSVSALNLIGLLFGAGAFAGPAFAGVADRLWGSTLPALWLGLAGVILLLPFAFIQTRRDKLATAIDKDAAQRAEESAEGFRAKARKVLSNPLVWALGALLIVYVGAENAMGGWTAEYVKQTTGAALAVAALAASLFWLALAGGRLLAAAFGTRLKPNAVLGAGIVLALIGAGLLAASTGRLALSLVAIALVGAGYGSIYPTAFAMAAAAAPEAPGSATSIVAALGSLGGMVFPWAQGLILVGWGTGAAALFMLALGFLMLLFFFLQRGVAARMHAKNAGR
jgi:FHS family glucose/mannose:H+ symporter-like MFS transporter